MFQRFSAAWIHIALLTSAAISLLNCGGGRDAGKPPILRAWTEQDPRIGGQAVVLRCDGAHTLEARIAPSAGANLYSLSYDSRELIYLPDTLSVFDGSRYGTPVLYPTPCRIPGGKFTFGGENFDFGINRDDTHIHGLVRDAEWQWEPPVVEGNEAVFSAWIDFEPDTPLYVKFPFRHRLILTFALHAEGLKISFAVKNRDSRPLPFGLGFHPYWNYVGGREDIWLSAPVSDRMELENLTPTGRLIPVTGTTFDISHPVEVYRIRMDDVFYRMEPGLTALIDHRRSKTQLTLNVSRQFGHLIVYAQPENPFFCVENLTASPDAHNLHARGFPDESGLIAVPPHSETSGWIEYVVETVD